MPLLHCLHISIHLEVGSIISKIKIDAVEYDSRTLNPSPITPQPLLMIPRAL